MNAADCGDPTTEVCDPYLKICEPAQCDGAAAPCPANKVCLSQTAGGMVGACYNDCTAFSANSGCTAGQFCIPVDPATNAGACFTVGTGGLNMQCTQDAVSTGCVTGSVCVNDALANPVCRTVCDLWNAPGVCGVGLHCVAGDLCSSQVPDPATIGGTCAAAAVAGAGCAAVGKAVTGSCQGTAGSLTCFKFCRVGNSTDCTSPATCMAVFTGLPSLGLCE